MGHFEKAIEIRQQSSSTNQNDLGVCYNDIGLMYEKMNNFTVACDFYQRAVAIADESLPRNHPASVRYASNLDRVKTIIGIRHFLNLSI